MKLGVAYPNPLGGTLAEASRSAEAGAQGLLVRPEVFLDETLSLKADPDEIASAFGGAGLEMAGVEAARPVLSSGLPESDYLGACIDLADALRDYVPEGAFPAVVARPGPGSRSDLWDALVKALKALAELAEGRGVVLAIAPERGSVVDRSRTALQMLGDVGSSFVQVAFDAAATVGDKDTLDSAVERLKDNIVLACARDVRFDQDGKPSYLPPGKGVISYGQYVKLLGSAPGCGYLIATGLSTEEEAREALSTLSGLIGA